MFATTSTSTNLTTRPDIENAASTATQQSRSAAEEWEEDGKWKVCATLSY